MENPDSGAGETVFVKRRLQLIALSRKLRHEHSQLREASMLLRDEGKQLSEESRVLRTNGQTVEKIVEFLRMPAMVLDSADPEIRSARIAPTPQQLAVSLWLAGEQ